MRIEPAAGDEVIGALLDDRIDVALVGTGDARLEAVAVQHLFDDEVVAVVKADHPWTALEAVDGPALAGASIILGDMYESNRAPAIPLPLPVDARPGEVLTVPMLPELMVEMVSAGQGIAVLPRWLVGAYLASRDLVALPVAGSGGPKRWSCITRQGEQPAHIQTFVTLLTSHFQPAAPAHSAG